MFSLLLHCLPADEDRLSAELFEAGTAGISEEPGGLRAFFEDESDRQTLEQRFALYQPEFRREDPVDWAQVSRDAWPPVLVGQRFFLVPPWRSDPTPPGRLRLEMTPGMACGTGHHPATQLCLEAMDRYVLPGSTVLDVGTGSGILMAAAQLLGAAQVVGCDIDPAAIEVARDRVKAPLFIGSVDAVRSRCADMIVANISSAVVEELAGDFQRVRKQESVLILSGFQEWDLPEGFQPRESLRKDEWLCLVC